ncbi:hypothetical protein ACI79J_13890 [Geodermatophilus sp. SYSU D01062]
MAALSILAVVAMAFYCILSWQRPRPGGGDGSWSGGDWVDSGSDGGSDGGGDGGGGD